MKQPPIQEKEYKTEKQAKNDVPPFDFFFFYALCAQTGQGKEHNGKQFWPHNGRKQAGCSLKIQEYLIEYADVDAPFYNALVTKPIHIDNTKYDTDCPHELHDFG